MPVWNRLIRFVAADGKTYSGEPVINNAEVTVDQLLAQGTLEAKVITGDVLSDDATVTDQVVKVVSLLAPLSKEQVPIIKCVGLNYKAHSKFVFLVWGARTLNLNRYFFSCRGWPYSSALPLHFHQVQPLAG